MQTPHATKLVKFYYKTSNQKWVKNVIKKRSLRKELLDNAAETDTYNDCLKIYKKFDPSRLSKLNGIDFKGKSLNSGFVHANNTIKQPSKGLSEKAEVYRRKTREILKSAENERKIAADERRKAAMERKMEHDKKEKKNADEMSELMSKFVKVRNNGLIGVPVVK